MTKKVMLDKEREYKLDYEQLEEADRALGGTLMSSVSNATTGGLPLSVMTEVYYVGLKACDPSLTRKAVVEIISNALKSKKLSIGPMTAFVSEALFESGLLVMPDEDPTKEAKKD